MTIQQQRIAETAIALRQAPTFGQLQDEVSQVTGVATNEVKETIIVLVQECILKQCATPTHKFNASLQLGITWAWYTKGACWLQ
jgi:hypothetical protein